MNRSYESAGTAKVIPSIYAGTDDWCTYAVDGGALLARARGWTLSQALVALAYYTMETNPVLTLEARRWLAEVLAESI